MELNPADLVDPADDFADPSTLPVTVLGQGATIAQARGTVRRYGLNLVDPADGSQLVATFDDSTATRAVVWPGEEGAAAATPATSWASSADGQMYLVIAPADLAALDPQPWPIRVEAERGGEWQAVWSGWLDVLPEPAAAAPPRVYNAYRDMVKLAGDSIANLRSVAEGAGFLASRVEARQWLDGVILARYRPAGFAAGGGFGSLFQPATGLTTSIDAPSEWLRGVLDAGGLLLRDLVVEIAARKSLAILFGRQTDPGWLAKSAAEHYNADQRIAELVAEIDTNGDGRPDLTINCGVFNTRSI